MINRNDLHGSFNLSSFPLVRNVFLIIFLLVFMPGLKSQCSDGILNFQPGEKISHIVYYNWGFIWVNAGWVDFSVKDSVYKDENVLFFDSRGSSHKAYDWIFKVRDRYKALVDNETMQPIWFHRKNYEGGFEVENTYIFDQANNRVFAGLENSEKPFREDTIRIPDCTYDVLSLVYHARRLNFSGLEYGDTVPVISIIDGEVFNLYIRYLGREVLKTREGEKYNCIKFSALLVEGTIFRGGEDLFVWVTDDKNRVPVLVEAKIQIGSVKAYLTEAKGLKYPNTALIKD